MAKVIGMLAALALFCALPAVALAQDGNTSSGNEQNAEINQGAVGGDAGNGGVGGDAGNQAAIVQQNAGDDANAEVNQEQNFGGDTVVGGDVDNGHGHGDVDGRGHGHGGGDVTVSGGVGGGVGGVTLARTGFDAWIFALIGGALLAGGIGILAAQRRGRLSA